VGGRLAPSGVSRARACAHGARTPPPCAFFARCRAKNAADIAALDAKVAEAKDKYGETEVFDAQRDKADYFARVGDKVRRGRAEAGCGWGVPCAGARSTRACVRARGERPRPSRSRQRAPRPDLHASPPALLPVQANALACYDALPQKGLSTGQRIDVVMAKVRLAFAHEEWPLATTLLAAARELNDKGGDWDRRNRLKVYEAMLALVQRGACARGWGGGGLGGSMRAPSRVSWLWLAGWRWGPGGAWVRALTPSPAPAPSSPRPPPHAPRRRL
jgi:hypothetical protein